MQAGRGGGTGWPRGDARDGGHWLVDYRRRGSLGAALGKERRHGALGAMEQGALAVGGGVFDRRER